MFKLDTFARSCSFDFYIYLIHFKIEDLLLSPFQKLLDGLHPFSGILYREVYFSNNTLETIVSE